MFETDITDIIGIVKITSDKIRKAVLNQEYRNAVIKRKVDYLVSMPKRKKGIAGLPDSITLTLTNSCNLRCYMCAQYGDSGACKSIEKIFINPELVRKLARELSDRCVNFVLMGGEPMLHPDWLHFVSVLKDCGHTCEIITNGTLIHRDASGIIDSGIDTVNISIDGLSGIHDSIRGVPGIFDKIIDGLRALVSLKSNSACKHPKIVIFFTITKENHKYLVEFARWIREFPIDEIRFFHLRFFSENELRENHRIISEIYGNCGSPYSGFHFDPGNIDTSALTEQIISLRSDSWPFKVVVQPDIPAREFDGYYHREFYCRSGSPSCSIPWTSAVVLPDGQVHPCLDLEMGNLNESSFMDIWNNDRFRTFRLKLNEIKRFPVCQRCCF